MPIVDCGFAPFHVVPNQAGQPTVIPGGLALVGNGPTLQVEIGFSADMFHPDPAKVAAAVQAVNVPAASPQILEALVDTGETESAIDEELAQQLKLPLIDRIDGSGIGGTEKFNVYLGHIRVIALGYFQYGRFMGVKLRQGGQQHCALIGRSVLQNMVMVYDGRDGSVRIAI